MSYLTNPYRYVVAEIIDCTGLTGSTNAADSGRIRASPVTASTSFTVSKIQFNASTGSGGNIKFSIYSDNSDLPDALLATTGSHTAVDGVQDYALVSPYTVSSGTKYWLSFQNDFTVTMPLGTGSDGARAGVYTNSVAFASTPDPFATPINDTTSGTQICMVS